MRSRILLLQGPNLNLLGVREPHLYGHRTLSDIHADLTNRATNFGLELICYQSNSESALIHRVHDALHDHTAFIIINPAAFTHQSVALRDAILGVNLPFVEVHLSNVYAREPFRVHSYFSDKAVGVITGLGEHGYNYALQYAHDYLASRATQA